MKTFFLTLCIFFVLLTGWEIFSHFNQNFIFILPSPSQVMIRLWEKLDRFWFHTHITLMEMVFGFLLAFLVAFPLAWIMDLYKSASAVLQPLFIVIQCIPMFTLAPIMIIWFGWSFTAIVVPTALMIFFPLTINIYQGLRSTSPDLLDFFKMNQATPWQTFYKLKLPGALPHIFGGFRLATAVAGIAAVAGEWAGAQSGLGILMLESRRDTDLETNFAALFCLTLISCLLYLMAVLGEYLVLQRRDIGKNCRAFIKRPIIRFAVILASAGGLLFLPFYVYKISENMNQVRLTLDWLPNSNHVPIYVGVHKGFFRDQGIQLKIEKLQDSGTAVSFLTSGQSELALNYMPNTIRVCHKGAKLKPIGILIKEPLNAIIFRKNTSINSPSDLTGKRIGFSTGGKDCTFLDAFLRQNSIFPSEKFNVGFDLVPFFGSQRVDAIYGGYWNIEIEHLRSLGIESQFFKLEEFGVPSYYEIIVLARTDSDQSQPGFIQRFQRALQQSINYSKLNPEEAFQIYSELQQDRSEKTQQWEWEAWKRTLTALADHQEISSEVWQTFENWLKSHKLL